MKKKFVAAALGASVFFSLGTAMGESYASTSSTGGSEEATNFAKEAAKQTAVSALKDLIPSFGADQPEWMKRIELNWDFLNPGKSEQSILTVQPLYQSDDLAHTVFVQGSVLRYALYGDYRWTGNIGTGYRHLLANNSVLLGVNTFFDNEFTNGHRRTSIGTEAKWNVLDFGFNEYVALTGDKTVSGDIERALSGRDLHLTTQMPYMPWAKVGGGYFWWDAERATKGMDGATFTATLALHPNFSLEYKWSSYDVNNNGARGQNSVMLTFSLARTDVPTLTTGPILAAQPFEKRDLRKETLTKVVRENKIVVERRTTGGSVIIARGD